MQHETPQSLDQRLTTLPSIESPPILRASRQEIARRRALAARARGIRDEIGPIGVSTSDLIRQARDEADDSE